MAFDPNNTYQPGAAPTGAFPGTTDPSGAPTGLSSQWARTQVVTDPPHAAKDPQFEFLNPATAQTSTVGQLLLEFDTRQSSPQDIDALQALLWNGGFFGDAKAPPFTPGQRDAVTRAAFVRALKEASRGQAAFGDFLDTRASARSQSGLVGHDNTPQLAQLSDPAALNIDLDQAMTAALGHTATAEQKMAFAAGVHHAETVRAQTVQAGQTAAGGVVPVTDVDPQAQAVQFAHQSDPTGYDARRVVGAADVVRKMLTGGA